jgi:hypothetical protein
MKVPGSPAPLVKAALVSFLTTTARVVRDVPDKWTPSVGPVVLVADDGGPLNWPVMSRNTVRVTVFAEGKDAARLIALRCAGHLHDNTPAGITHVFRDGGTILEARDPQTGADMASFLITATVRTVEIV